MKKGRDSAIILRKSVYTQLPLRRLLDAALDSPRIWMEALETRRMFSAPANLDFSFGHHGKAFVANGGAGAAVNALALGPGGTIYVAGETDNGLGIDLIRIKADGSADPSFGAGGIATCDLGLYATADHILVQADGKVIVVSGFDNATRNDLSIHAMFARFNSDGTVDTTFGGTGSVDVICNNNISGSFNQYWDFLADTPAALTSIGMDGKITVISKDGTDIQLARLNADGSPDGSFGPAGQRFTSLQSTPNIFGQDLIAGALPDGGYVVDTLAYNPRGDALTMLPQEEYRFDHDGNLVSQQSVPRSLPADATVTLPDGRTLLYTLGLPSAGSLSNNGSFATLAGGVDPVPSAYPVVSLLSISGHDGKIVVAGRDPVTGTGAIQRFNADGSPDFGFSGGSVMAGLGDGALGSALELPDGSIIVGSSVGPYGGFFELFKVLPGGPGDPNAGNMIALTNHQSSVVPTSSGNGVNGIFGNGGGGVLDFASHKRLLGTDDGGN